MKSDKSNVPKVTSSTGPHVSSKGEHEDRRCCCGALLARVLPEGIEIKCRRCRHFCLVPFSEMLSDETKALLSNEGRYFVLAAPEPEGMKS